MKTQLLPKVSLVLVVAALSLGGCSKPPATAEPAAASGNSDVILAMQSTDESPSLDQQVADEGDISDAAVKPADMPNTVTPPVQLNAALSEMVQIAQSGVDENVLIAYVTNCASTFNAGPEEIIYLNDIGVAPEVVTAMIVHDRELREAAPVPSLIPNAAASAELSTVSYTTSPTMVDPAFSRQDAGTETYAVPAQPSDVSNNDFYGSLAPYGNWVDVAGFGRCWQPTVVSLNPEWRPYCDGGRWVYSDCGWYWLSDYSWGWAPFHYGRWFRHTALGWCWVPDTTWGPSWVSWRYSDDYCGWAPLPPLAGYRPGFGFTYAGHIVAADFEFGLTSSCFTFVPFRDFCDRHPRRHIVASHQVDQIFHRTVVSTRVQLHNHIVINNGLPADRVTAATHKELHPIAVRQYRGTAARGLRLQHLESGGTALTTERPDRTSPIQTLRHQAPQPGSPRGNGQLQVNAGRSAYPSQTSTQPERFQSSEGSRANNVHIVTTQPQAAAPSVQANANHEHPVYIRSYPQPVAHPGAALNYAEQETQPVRQNPSWFQTGNGFDNRRQPQHNQQVARPETQPAPSWNQNVPAEPQQLVDRRTAPREVPNRSGFGNSFTASQSPAASEYTGAQANPRVNYQSPPVQHLYQPPQNYSPPPAAEPRSNFRPTENRAPAMEPRSESRSSVSESHPAPAPAPVTHERASSNDHSSDRGQDRPGSNRR